MEIERRVGEGSERVRKRLNHDLRGAVDRGEMLVAYQPIVSATNGSVVGAEALLRWNHPVVGVIAPDMVVPLAEQSGLVGEIGGWILQRAPAWTGTGGMASDGARSASR